MEAPRFLLPFTHGIHIQAIEQTMRLAQSRNATIVLVSLIPLPVKRPQQGARLEHIQQARDMQRTLAKLAHRHHVTVEMHESFTTHTVNSVIELTAQLHCDTVILVLQDQKAVLLHTPEAQQLLEKHDAPFFIIHLPPKQKLFAIIFAPPEAHTSHHREIIQVQWYCKKKEEQCLKIEEQDQEKETSIHV